MAGFSFNIYVMKSIKSVCSNQWCKATFEVMESDMTVGVDGEFEIPKFCRKCIAQEDFVSWEDKRYEGERWDGTPHQFTYKIKKFF